MKKLIIATKNKGKMTDFNQLLSKYGIETMSLLDFDQPIADIEETGTTFSENAAIKAETIANQFNLPVLADDSGLVVDYLDGRPGVYSARYAGEDKNDQANYQKVLQELEDIPQEDRTARFVCVLALARPNESTVFKEGTCEGTIADEPKGENGFGYDPIFYPINVDRTLAEMTTEEKNSISHRKNAMVQLEQWINQQQ
ncbi:XTP/dITP diphosphatase [Aquibacillus sediminis]|uniref:XTP/dITP diphosphatase n=1 Tax=Aquibacillus sediminis TaxID=2574734 RepID=UPI001107EC37|nr:XTP/dITP diphosphatase [Aquibacillus sediminis]